MKIVLKYYGNKYQKRPGETIESFMRIAFAHISHQVWIKSINVLKAAQGQSNDDFDLVEIEVNPQGTESEQKMINKIEEAIKMRGQLELVSIGQKRIIQIEAIEAADDNTYKVDLGYAVFVSKNEKYREELKTQKTVSAKCEYVNVQGDKYSSTGKISTEVNGGANEFDPNNIYNCFAVALSESPEFRAKIIGSDLLELILKVNAQSPQNPKGSLVISIVERNTYRFFMPSPAADSTASADVSQKQSVAKKRV